MRCSLEKEKRSNGQLGKTLEVTLVLVLATSYAFSTSGSSLRMAVATALPENTPCSLSGSYKGGVRL